MPSWDMLPLAFQKVGILGQRFVDKTVPYCSLASQGPAQTLLAVFCGVPTRKFNIWKLKVELLLIALSPADSLGRRGMAGYS